MPQTLDQIWDQTLTEAALAAGLNADALSWFKNVALVSVSSDQAYIKSASSVANALLNQNRAAFESALSALIGHSVSVVIVSEQQAAALGAMESAPVLTGPNPLLKTSFNEEYTFDTFVEGESNKEAYASCLGLCTGNFLSGFNPLLLYGTSGLGKTHLLHAMGNYLLQNHPGCRIIYFYADEFVSLIIESMKNKNIPGKRVEDVKKQILDCDYFLLDDIQNLTQNASNAVFFNLYNALLENGTKVIMTSDTNPQELDNLHNRLISRFNAGLVVCISRPNIETAKAIIRKKIEGKEEIFPIQDEVVDFLASKFSNDVRKLEGTLNRLIFNSTLFPNEAIDLDFARSVLQEDVVHTQKRELTIKDVIKAVSGHYGLTPQNLEGKSRQTQIVTARSMCVYLARELLEMPYTRIGLSLGKRDHKTIANSYKKACDLMKKNPDYAKTEEYLEKSLIAKNAR